MRTKTRLTVPILCASLSAAACIAPRMLFVTDTEVLEQADSMPIFGDHLDVRYLEKEVALSWDTASRRYVASDPQVEQQDFRAARLKSDVYLFQGRGLLDRFTLLPIRILESGEVDPLACEPTDDLASEFGLALHRSDELSVELHGDRSRIIGFLSALVDTCTPLLHVESLHVPRAELAAHGAARGSVLPSCMPCSDPRSACIRGSVIDEIANTGLPAAEVTVHHKWSGSHSVRADSGPKGEFALVVPPGPLHLSVSLQGFTSVETRPLDVSPGYTYVFESPFSLRETAVQEIIFVPQAPVTCTAGPARSP